MKYKTILVVDDEQTILDSVRMVLEFAGYRVLTANHAMQGLQIADSESIDAVMLDIRMEGMDGLTCLNQLRKLFPQLPVVMMSGVASVDMAISAVRSGAYDFLEKPLDRDRVLIVLRNALQQSELLKENAGFQAQLEQKYTIIGNSSAMQKILEIVDQVAPTEARVLITGENGSGKELVARRIHRLSKRAEQAFIELNCAAIPGELIESELFGHEKGSFTGAHQRQIGKFEHADKGTLFFDEVGDMALSAQAKTLKAIEEGVIQRIGGKETINVNVRIISATNKELSQEIYQRRFREDLYFRLNVVPIHLPPLRERRDDIPLLVDYFIRQFCDRENMSLKELDEEAMTLLLRQPWYGNIRELRNVIERAVILCRHSLITANQLILDPIRGLPSAHDKWSRLCEIHSFQGFRDESEKEYLLYHLDRNNWHVSRAAQDLGMQRSNLYIKINKYFPDKIQSSSE